MPDNVARFSPWSGPYPFVHEVNLTGIPEGKHTITVQAIEKGIYGLHQFAIKSSETIHFTIGSSSEATVPEFPSGTILPLVLVATFLVFAVRKRLLRPSSQRQ